MKKLPRTPLVIVASIGLGAVFGPVLIAVLAAAFWPSMDWAGETDETYKLVDAYQDRLDPGLLFLTLIPPPDGAECGYKPQSVFPDGLEDMIKAGQTGAYFDYEGYYALNRWRSANRDEDWIGAITAEIDKAMTPFEAGFLRRCIESTLFTDICMARVERYGDLVPRFDGDWERHTVAGGHEDQVVCTFVDGVAARRGVPLVERQRK